MTKSEYTEIKVMFEGIRNKIDDMEAKLDRREHIDQIVLQNQEFINGNGKPGFKSIRDKVLGWEARFNTLIILFVGDVLLQLWRAFAK